MLQISQHKTDGNNQIRITVVIPCYKVRAQILDVLNGIPSFVDTVFVVDDACPEGTGTFVQANNKDPRVQIIYHETNQGVGGAVISGYQNAIESGSDIILKLDGDGQMDPSKMAALIAPLVQGKADYAKGNRFYNLETLKCMPASRIFGNAVLSFMNKLSTGYWDIFDPTNGYTAITKDIAIRIPWTKVSKRYFFESDLLFRLNTYRAVVVDIPMDAKYGNENSNLRISRVIGEFLYKHKRNALKRVFYNYFLRDFSIATLNLILGFFLVLGGAAFGTWSWYKSAMTGLPQTAGTVMLAALPIILGLQLLLSFLAYDVANTPSRK